MTDDMTADFTRTVRAMVAANDRVPEQRAGEDEDARDRAVIAALHDRWDGLPGRLAPHIALADVRAALREAAQ